MNEILFRAMGSEIYCAVDSAHKQVTKRLEYVPAMFEAWEKTLSRFRSDSELSLLNAGQGEAVHVSETLWRVLKRAQRAEMWSDFLVTPMILNALERAGYDRSFDRAPVREILPNACDVEPAQIACVVNRAHTGWRMNDAAHTVSVAQGTRLDLGGVAKGWAAEQTAQYLGELGATMVDAGGDIMLTAPGAYGAWHIAIENPFAPENEDDLPVLEIARGAVATSGRDFRKWTCEGKSVHHLIDPRTGLPAKTDVLTATVIAPTLFDAEVAAKVALILGSGSGMKWIDEHCELAARLILEDGSVLTSSRMEKFLQ